jgi:hypothetical protein
LLFVGDQGVEAHHDGELMDATGRRLVKARLPEGVVEMARWHAMIAEALGEDAEEAEVLAGTWDRAGSVGSGAGRGGVHGVRDQPGAASPLPAAAQRLGR